MNKKILLTFTVLLFALAGTALALDDSEYKVVQRIANEYMSNVPNDGYHILAENVLKKIQSGKNDFVIVDVRMPKEKKYDQGHLPGAIYIGFTEIAKPENLAKLPKDKEIIVYCDTGHEQSKVLSVLRMLGYEAYDMKWGMMSWKTLPPSGFTLKSIEGSILNNYPVAK